MPVGLPALFALPGLVLAAAACKGKGPPPGGGDLFVEVTRQAGLPDPDSPWPDGRYQLPEITAAGVALFDADGDGDLDLFLICHPPPDRPDSPAPDRLFRQDAPWRFSEVSGAAGLADPGYGNGAAVGDVDGDGHPDVYVANLGRDALYRNRGDGTFADVTASAGIEESEWTTAAAFLDHDRDGDLDLYAVHYLVNDPSRVCVPSQKEKREYCGPSRYQSVADRLFRNRGDGAFEDVSRQAGIVEARAGLGIACADFSGDGWVDIFVANDRQPNLLYVNRRDGTFVDEAHTRGVALSGSGEMEASMGVAMGEVNGDGRLDLFVTALAGETGTLYLSAGSAALDDASSPAGLGASTIAHTGWGTGFADLDLDGDLDLAVVNGRVARWPAAAGARLGAFWNEYAETNQVFLNAGDANFTEASRRGGTFSTVPGLDRALAFGDLDGDGDVDLATADLANRLRLFRNDAPPPGNRWLRVRALAGKRDALGALVTVRAGGARQVRPLLSAYSYASASEPVAHFGLGSVAVVESVEVAWPDGKVERFPGFRIDGAGRLLAVRQGEGSAVAAP
jgi:hypothetical protein